MNGFGVDGLLAERRIVWIPSTTNSVGLVTSTFRNGTLAARQRVAQALDRGLGLEPQRIVGLHAQDEVHAALEVETEVDLLGGRDRRPRPPPR